MKTGAKQVQLEPLRLILSFPLATHLRGGPVLMASLRPSTEPASLDAFVLQHLQARGFTGAAAALQAELQQDGVAAEPSRPALIQEFVATMRLKESYEALRDWVQDSIEAFQAELRAVLFPFFVHCYLELVAAAELEQATALLHDCQDEHVLFHRAEVNLLSQVTAPSHLATHEFARRVRSRRCEVPLCAYSRGLLMHFLQQPRAARLLAILNSHITLRVERLALPPETAQQDNAAPPTFAAVAASTASQLWMGLSEEAATAANSAVVEWGAPAVLLDKHAELAEKLGVPPPHAALAGLAGAAATDDAVDAVDADGEEGAEAEEGGAGGRGSGRGSGRGGGRGSGRGGGRGGGRKDDTRGAEEEGDDDSGRGSGARGRGTGGHGGGARGRGQGGGAKRKRGGGSGEACDGLLSTQDGGTAPPVPVLVPRVPLPPLSDELEEDIVRKSKHRVALSGGTPPSVALVTWLDAAAQLCACALSNAGAIVAGGFADGSVRLAMLKKSARAAPSKKKKAKAAGSSGGPAAAAAGGAWGMRTVDGAAEDATDGGAPAVAEGGGDGEAAAEDATETADAAARLRQIAVLRGHSGPVYSLAFSRDDHYVISGSQDGTARLWGVLQRACLVVYRAHATPVWTVAFAPLGPYFATGGYDRTLRLWRVDAMQPLRLLCGHLADVRCVAFHPNVSLLASGSEDASVRIWDLQTAKPVRLLCRHGHASAVSCVAFSPDGITLASGGDDRMLLLWHAPSATLRRRIAAHASPLWCCTFSCEGAHVVTSSHDCTLAVWDAPRAMSLVDSAVVDGTDASSAAVGSQGSRDVPRPPKARIGAGTDRPAERFLVSRLHTKHTPVLVARYLRTNVLLAAGAFEPPKP